MKKNFILSLILISTVSFAQTSDQIDSLLFNAQYEAALISISKINTKNLEKGESIKLENKKTDALIHLGKFEEAEKTLGGIQTQSDSYSKAITLTNYGSLYMNQGKYDKAMEALQEAISEFENSNKEKSLEAAQAISNIGLVYNATGKHIQAQEQLIRALALRQNILKENHELIAASYNDLGLAYANLDNDKALDHYEKALKIYTALHGKEHPKIAIASINNGYIYRNLELYGDANNNFATALKIWEKVYHKAHPAKAFALLNLGETYNRMGNLQASRGYFEKALSMYKESYGEKHPDIAQVFNSLGNIELASQKYDLAIGHYQQAIIANVNDFQNKNENINPPLKNYYNGNVLLYSLLYKAQAFEKRYLERSLRFSDLTKSLNTLQYCDTLVDKLRQQSSNESDKIALGVIANEVYGDGVRIANESALNAIKKKKYVQLAFYFAEKSKSAVLLEAISDANAKSFAGIPQDLMDEENNLKSAISLTAQKLSQKPGTEEERYLRETSYTLNRRYETFIKKLENQFPQYFNLKFNAASPSIVDIQNLLDSKTAVISYFADEKNARLYTFLITAKKFKLTEQSIPKDFDKNITGFRNSLFFNAIDAFKITASKLYKILIPENIPGYVTELVILPTGRMSLIPFESLLTETRIEETDYSNFSYLVEQYAIRYEFSASLLLQKAKTKKTTVNPSIFLCAPVSFPKKDGLDELPGTESEVTQISQLFINKNLNASLNVGLKANETLIKDGNLSKYNLLHFATHGVVDEYNPELSRVFLQTSSDSEDGNLFSGEIYNLQLNANLVTLSACQTGLGKISKGEGVIGLSRALVYAGAKSIIVSYWSVADESTSVLMQNFYRTLLNQNTQNFSGSLRQAKIDLIQNKKFAAPYYWAPFILIGF